MSGGQEQQNEDSRLEQAEPLDEALDRSAHELQLLANFYHQHNFPERAQEIYRTILKIQRDRDKKQPCN